MEKIKLLCEVCHKTLLANRIEIDPPNAVECLCLCDVCCDRVGAMDPQSFYFDKDGNELNCDPESKDFGKPLYPKK